MVKLPMTVRIVETGKRILVTNDFENLPRVSSSNKRTVICPQAGLSFGFIKSCCDGAPSVSFPALRVLLSAFGLIYSVISATISAGSLDPVWKLTFKGSKKITNFQIAKKTAVPSGLSHTETYPLPSANLFSCESTRLGRPVQQDLETSIL